MSKAPAEGNIFVVVEIPRGSRNKTTMAAITLLEGEAEALTRIAIEKALGGDMVALRLCLERIAPPAKGRAVEIDLPAIETPTDVVAAIGAGARAMAAGDITPEEAQTVAGVIETQRRAVETAALRQQFREEKVLVEEDADNEVDDEKASYESKLITEKRLTQKLRDENGLSKKKFAQLTKDVEDQKEEMASLRDREFDLRESIKNLEKDVQGHKKEIRRASASSVSAPAATSHPPPPHITSPPMPMPRTRFCDSTAGPILQHCPGGGKRGCAKRPQPTGP